MDKELLKYYLKQLKYYESTGSMILGIVTVIFLGIIFFKSLSFFKPQKIQKSAQQTQATPTPSPTKEKAKSAREKTYVVKPGDGLWQIAQSQLGDGNRFMEIYQLNSDKMKHPDDISEGMTLLLPSVDIDN